VWKPWKGGPRPDPPAQGVRHYSFIAAKGGYYRLLLRASGADVDAYNTFWVRLGRGARRVYPDGRFAAAPDGWLNVWQRAGGARWAWGSIEAGAAPVTRWLRPGERYTVSLAGRSSRAAVDKLVFYQCTPAEANCGDNSDAYRAAVKASWGPSKCGGGGGGGPPPPPPPSPPPRPSPPKPTDKPQPQQPAPGNGGGGGGRCYAYSAAGGVVRMSAVAAGGGGGWVVGSRSGRRALIFKPNKDSHSVDGPGQGVKAFRFRVAAAGTYRIAFRLSAPHWTEYNDLWARLGGGARMVRGGRVRPLSAGWVKVYQNRGRNQWVLGGVTKDFDGHDLVTRPLRAGETYTLTVSGRSSKLALADVAAFKCNLPGGCGNGSDGFRRISKMDVSRCA